MIYKGFRIENTPAYIWRIYCWGSHAGHNHVACWYVFDAEGKRVTGGYASGNNTRSGTVDLARRKDAKAWVDGYCAYRDEPENRQPCANGTAVYAPHYARHVPDTELEANFDAGYWYAQREPQRGKGEIMTVDTVPPYIGRVPLVGSFYAAECTRCGWVGSSQELTDDCQCTRDVGGHYCLGDTDEISTERLLGIIQAIAQGEPVAWQARFIDPGQQWAECSKEHHDFVKANPSEWSGYEVRELYTAPATNS